MSLNFELMKKRKFDWKSTISIAFTIIGALAGFFVWYMDQNSKEISIDVISSIELDPVASGKMSGFELKFNKENVDDPFLQVVEIRNSGSKPIPSSDYEDALRISFGDEIKLLKVNLLDVFPEDIDPKIEIDKNSFKMMPLLLNSGELIRFSFLTSNGIPKISAKARVLGAKIKLNENPSHSRSKIRSLIYYLIPLFLLFIYVYGLYMVAVEWETLDEFPIFLAFSSFVSGMAGIVIYSSNHELIHDRQNYWDVFVYFLPSIVVSAVVCWYKSSLSTKEVIAS